MTASTRIVHEPANNVVSIYCPMAGVTVWVYLRIEFVNRSICLAVKIARQHIVNQSENGYGWDNYTDY